MRRSKGINPAILALWGVIALLSLALAGSVWDGFRLAETRAQASALTYARMIADHATATFRLADVSLRHLTESLPPAEMARARTLSDEARDRLQSLMLRHQRQVPGIVSMSLTDAAGIVFANTVGTRPGSDLGDRAYFLQLKAQDDDRPVISEAIKGRVSNKWGVQFARRITDPNGRFVGMVVANIGLDEYFGAYYASVGAEPGTSFSLWTSEEGKLMVRFPVREGHIGKPLPFPALESLRRSAEQREISVISASPVDGSVKAIGIHKLSHFPIHAVAAVDRQTYLETWRQSAVRAGFGIAALLVGGIFLTVLTLRKCRSDEALTSSEEKLRSLFEMSPLGIARNGMDGTFIEANQAFLGIVGYSLDELRQLSYWQLTPERYAEYEQVQLDLLHLAGRYGPYEKEYIHKDGHLVSVRLSGALITGSDGQRYIWSTVEDITQHVQSERAMIDYTKSLARSNADLEQFAYVASHDLQTPLRNVVSYSQLLSRRYAGKLDQDADDFLSFIVDSARHMSLLINDLLEYSRVASRTRVPEAVEARPALDRALENLALSIRESGARIDIGALPTVLADDNLLTSLFQNLIGNAIKYRHPDRLPLITVSADRHDAERWRISVADNGIGIHEDYFQKIFEIFQRLAPLDNRDGTGIGLALCQRIVTRLGGAIWVESVVGEGARFHFTLLDGAEGARATPPHPLARG